MTTASLPPSPGDSLEESVREVAVGDVIQGKWVVQKKLGEGGMGTVVLAKEPELDRFVAVKLLARHLCRDDHAVARFEREARLTAQLDHPNIVPVFAVGRFHERPFMVMKHLEGTALGELLRARPGPWSWPEVRAVVEPLCRALAFLQGKDLVHRDVKPSNVIVGPAGQVTLLDFGILKQSSKDVTTTGMALGTYGWMAPEQVVPGGRVDARADLYALGLLVYRMLAGRLPFAGEEAVVAQRKVAGEAPDPRVFNPGLSALVAAALLHAIRRDPLERFASAHQLLAAFDAAHEGRGPVPTTRGLNTRAPWRAAGVVAGMIALLGGVWALVPRAAPRQIPEPAVAQAPARPLVEPPMTAPALPAPTPRLAQAPARHLAPAKPRPGHPSSNEPVKVSVVSRISGKASYAELFVDGKRVGETPTSIELSPGSHRIRLVREGFAPYEEQLDFGAGRNERVAVDLHPQRATLGE